MVRACARFDAARVAGAIEAGKATAGALLGHGHLAMTIDQGTDKSRYQGLVALDGGSLEDAAHEYFKSSEQIPTRVRLAVGEEMSPGAGHRWRAGGMLLQFLPKAPERARVPDLDPGDAPEGMPAQEVQEDDAWVEGRSMISTVEDLELLDPSVSSERLVYRLFHERGVRVFKSVPIVAQCSCSRGGVEEMLRNFSQDDRDHMVENGAISVTCEFCSANYQFAPDDVRPDANRPETVGGSSETKPSS
jgi:molecular chaperone Hsp33